ncbi:MAG: methylated-DNA--[protein]-cysteine S-methyltransferase [Actinobacteria bacterium]|nr:methylated-DNA--[protein]-cysteine S-methyltransferase [Actinomycetota bacterium]
MNSRSNDLTIAEAALRQIAPGSDAALAAAIERFTARAASDGAVDVVYEDHDSPFGKLRLAATPAGILRIGLPNEDPESLLDQIAHKLSPRVLRAPGGYPSLAKARRELDQYFAGKRRHFDLPLDWSMARAFRLEVLHVTALIPYGETVSYADLARAAGRPKAVRAAGTAMATNPLPIVVPCHRVLRSGGQLGNYGGGVEMKAELLRLEGSRPG